MKVLIVSDSHGERSVLDELKERYGEQTDAMIHCGDSELQADDPSLEGFTIVRGNCDMDARLPMEQTLKVDGSRIFVAHGHRHNIKSTMMNLSYSARENGADCAFFGHSHLLGAEYADGILFVNPGSISYPRGGNDRTYAVAEKDEKGWDVRFFNEMHLELKHLHCRFPTV